MLTPVAFLQRYRRLCVRASDDPSTAGQAAPDCLVQLRTYFMMDWAEGSTGLRQYQTVLGQASGDPWYAQHRDRIANAAMGKGAPRDYELALTWALRSGRVTAPGQAALQAYCDAHLGIDCSGLVANYLVATGQREDTLEAVQTKNAASFFSSERARSAPSAIRPGDLLVWLAGASVKVNPGHIALVDECPAGVQAGATMRVVESTGAAGATPKVLDSLYHIEQIALPGEVAPVMSLLVRRHGTDLARVAVIRP